ncbi:MAG TPA: VWA domain-containing protein [Azospirillaceae bacterium]|nr:VWA domain-containing protein [Azospirillaceae bacterium]
MSGFLEVEESVGKLWHRLVGQAASYPSHPDAAIELESVKPRLAVFFRGLGGDGGVRLTGGGRAASGHRLSLRQRLGLGAGERLATASLDGATLALPARLDVFPDRFLNEALYEWLAAFFAHTGPATPRPTDPLQADFAFLHQAQAASRRVLEAWPGLRPLHVDLCAALRAARPDRDLPPWEKMVENAIQTLLIGGTLPAEPLDDLRAPPGYRPFLPVPLWGEVTRLATGGGRGEPEESEGGGTDTDGTRRKAARRDNDQTRRDDPLMLNRFEKIIGLAEMVNLNRAVEDDDADQAAKAADDLDEMAVGQHERKAATRLKLDLDLPPEAVDTAPLTTGRTYPEWDHTRRAYLPHHCRVIAEPALEEGEDWTPDDEARQRIRRVRRQFEALRPGRQVLAAQSDGDDLDLSALVRARADLRAGGIGSDRVFTSVRNAVRDLAVAVLVDVSLSTDAWIENRRVLDVEKEALTAFSHGLAACGDDHAIFTFTSRKRAWVNVRTVKDFDEPLSARVDRRIAALKPGYYTRMGAALRHVTARLEERPNRHRLVLMLTDGKPNDLDHYEGRFGIEDTRMAILEARRAGLKVFGITVDAEARDYFPYLFGRGSFAIFPHIGRLTAALPAIYRHLVA